MTETRTTHKLKPHPLNDEIYHDKAGPELVDSIAQKGILTPLLITYDNRIISGHRRFDAAQQLGLAELPVVVYGSTDELDIEEALIEANRQRVKTGEQIGREYKRLKEIYNKRESRQGERSDLTSLLIHKEVQPPTHKAAESIGVSIATANQAERVVDAIDQLEAQGDTSKADKLRDKLNQSVNGAYKTAKQKGLILIDRKPVKTPDYGPLFTVAQWEQLSEQQKIQMLSYVGDKQFNRTNDNVEWALWTWNPVTGCLHNCPYCYARDIANRFFTYLENDRFAPVFYPDRLTAPANSKQPDLSQVIDPIQRIGLKNVFVCSMADLFGKWVPTEWIETVLEQVKNNPQWNFLFLTKFPIRMSEFEYPSNAWLGTTVDHQWAVERAEKAFRKLKSVGYNGIAWLSCEPMMERLTFTSLDMFDWVVIGGSSRSSQTPEYKPPFDDIVHLYNQARQSNCKVYQKTNLIPGMSDEQRIREYPWE